MANADPSDDPHRTSIISTPPPSYRSQRHSNDMRRSRHSHDEHSPAYEIPYPYQIMQRARPRGRRGERDGEEEDDEEDEEVQVWRLDEGRARLVRRLREDGSLAPSLSGLVVGASAAAVEGGEGRVARGAGRRGAPELRAQPRLPVRLRREGSPWPIVILAAVALFGIGVLTGALAVIYGVPR